MGKCTVAAIDTIKWAIKQLIYEEGNELHHRNQLS